MGVRLTVVTCVGLTFVDRSGCLSQAFELSELIIDS